MFAPRSNETSERKSLFATTFWQLAVPRLAHCSVIASAERVSLGQVISRGGLGVCDTRYLLLRRALAATGLSSTLVPAIHALTAHLQQTIMLTTHTVRHRRCSCRSFASFAEQLGIRIQERLLEGNPARREDDGRALRRRCHRGTRIISRCVECMSLPKAAAPGRYAVVLNPDKPAGTHLDSPGVMGPLFFLCIAWMCTTYCRGPSCPLPTLGVSYGSTVSTPLFRLHSHGDGRLCAKADKIECTFAVTTSPRRTVTSYCGP